MILKANKELKQKDFKNEKELQNFFENRIFIFKKEVEDAAILVFSSSNM